MSDNGLIIRMVTVDSAEDAERRTRQLAKVLAAEVRVLSRLRGVQGEDLPLGFDLTQHPRRDTAGTGQSFGRLVSPQDRTRDCVCRIGFGFVFVEPGCQELSRRHVAHTTVAPHVAALYRGT
jgi:hypothetical protein